MEITIKFFKSSSKYYESVCQLSRHFDEFIQENSENRIIIHEDEIRDKTLEINNILETVRHWTKTEYYIDARRVNFSAIQLLVQIPDCEKNCNDCALGVEGHCYEGAGWGCNYISSIALRKGEYNPYRSALRWYDFGKFEDDVWIIDKTHIMELLEQEANEKALSFCSHFSMERIRQSVDLLLDQISVTEEGE